MLTVNLLLYTSEQITGDAEAVKNALTAVSAVMYKFSPKEEISLDTSVPDLPPIIIPSDIPIIPAGSLYTTVDSRLPPAGSVPPPIAATHLASEISGFTDTSNMWPLYPSALPIVPGYGGPTQSEDLILRVLCPSDKIGRVIGKGGSTIKSIRQSTGAKISVDDTKDDTDECVITVTSTEVRTVFLFIWFFCPQFSFLCSLLTGFQVSGEVGKLRDALVQIILRLREDALKDKEGNQNAQKDSSQNVPATDSLHSGSLSVPPVLPTIPPLAPLSYDQRAETERGLGIFPGSNLFGYNSLQAGENRFGSLSSYPSRTYGGLPAYIEMVIPANALPKVMGKGGTNVDNIRKVGLGVAFTTLIALYNFFLLFQISGAHIEIVDSKASHFERIARISGTLEQKRSAENLIQAFIMST
ncbi:hypothetical protein BHM03_00045082 [Ensete ventricosum]|nr:hypothetical protein BHM03_00045082 [Ensete ventricosum]